MRDSPPESAAGGAGLALLAWYERERRDLPWRREPSPYRILVAELMLQQTRVDVVVPFFERFVSRFPRVEALAAAPLEEVLAAWSGLGYYRRARALHATARAVVEGGWPRHAAELARLPGIGDYTAAAVASMAFGEAVPVLDGNVIRVLARRLARSETNSRRGREVLRAAAAELLVDEWAGDSNQALMELGAMVCRPRRPDCPRCPLLAGCRAHAAGEPERYPEPRPRPATVTVTGTVALVRSGEGVLLARRGAGSGLLAGSWEVPWVAAMAQPALERAFAERYGLDLLLGEARGEVRHSVTHHRLRLVVRQATLAAGEAGVAALTARQEVELRLVDSDGMARLGCSSLVAKALSLERGNRREPPVVAGA